MRSSVVVVAAEGPLMVETGFVYATRPNLPLPADLDPAYPFARHVLHVEPGRDPNSIAGVVQVIVDGRQVNWSPLMVAAGWPHGAPYVLEADLPNGARVKMVEVPNGVTPTASNIVGHLWAGDV